MIWQIPVNGYDSNFSYFVGGLKIKRIGIVDPVNYNHLRAEMEAEMLQPLMILLTHSHRDHVEGVDELVEMYGIPVYMHKNARGRVDVEETYTIFVEDGDLIDIEDFKVEVMHTPGHIDDALCFYVSAENSDDGVPKLITGDTVFVEGCGRADLQYSNVRDLYESLQRIKALPDNTKIYPGHDYGPEQVSTIGYEKKHNRFFKAKDFEEFRKLRMG